MRICKKCKIEKSPNDYALSARSPDGRRATCKQCEHDKYIEWRDADPARARAAWRRSTSKYISSHREVVSLKDRARKIGVSVEEVEKAINLSNGKCAICLTDDGIALHVDHCHDSGRIRGMLCARCNTALGLFSDSIPLLCNAIKYLNKAIPS